jgi:hypothetical protein
MAGYATGKHSVGFCRRCGDKVRLNQLRPDGQNNLLVCAPCFDIKHPAETPVRTDDAIALRRPAPDLDVVASRTLDDDRPLGEILFGAGNYFGTQP